jgi:hypothetical protein
MLYGKHTHTLTSESCMWVYFRHNDDGVFIFGAFSCRLPCELNKHPPKDDAGHFSAHFALWSLTLGSVLKKKMSIKSWLKVWTKKKKKKKKCKQNTIKKVEANFPQLNFLLMLLNIQVTLANGSELLYHALAVLNKYVCVCTLLLLSKRWKFNHRLIDNLQLCSAPYSNVNFQFAIFRFAARSSGMHQH